eukprot:gene25071-43656_t
MIFAVANVTDPALSPGGVVYNTMLAWVIGVAAVVMLLGDWDSFASPGTGALTRCIVGATVLWLAVAAADRSAHMGIADVWFMNVPPEHSNKLWDCAAPPCPLSPDITANNWFAYVVTF